MTPVLALLTSALRALAAYLEIKAKRLRLIEVEKTEQEADDLARQIEKLYAANDLSGAHRLLLAQARRRAILEGVVEAATGLDVQQPDRSNPAVGQ